MSWTSTQGHVVYRDRFAMRPYNLMLQVDAVNAPVTVEVHSMIEDKL